MISALVPPASLINPPPVVGAENLVPGPKEDDLWESGEGKLFRIGSHSANIVGRVFLLRKSQAA